MDGEPATLALLALAAFAGGTVDAIAGGGGLLTLPAVLATGLPVSVAMGTNKVQSLFGVGTALFRFDRAALVDRRQAPWTFGLGFLGSAAGAALAYALPNAFMRPLVLALLVAAAGFLAAGPAPRQGAAPPERRAFLLAGLIAAGLGAYDGFFGPGTGTFLILAMMAWLGRTATEASANAKVVNFASNVAAAAFFASQGAVVWRLVPPMAAAQIAAGWVGAHLAVRRGDRLVRRLVLVVVLGLVAKLAWDLRPPA